MKRLKTFNGFLYEGVRDKMTPKEEEEIIEIIRNSDISPHKRLDTIYCNHLEDNFSEKELKEFFEQINPDDRVSSILKYKPSFISKEEINDIINNRKGGNKRSQYF